MKNIVVIGAGIAGLEAASVLAKNGHHIYLIEKESSLGGHVAQWDRLFPTKRKASQVVDALVKKANDPNIELLTETTVQHIERKGKGYEVMLPGNKSLEADAILVASGFDLFDAKRKEEYGYGIYDRVITSADLEKMFENRRVVCKDGQAPKRIAFVHCVGSRDEKINNRYCSKLCCVTAVKQACEMKELYPDAEVFNLYMDLRMFDRHFESMYHEAQSKYGVNFIRGRLSEAAENKEGKLIIKTEDTLLGKPLKITVDMLVLMVGMEAAAKTESLSKKLNIQTAVDRFFSTDDEHLAQNLTSRPGIFLAGTASGPKSIPESLADARAAAMEIHAYLS